MFSHYAQQIYYNHNLLPVFSLCSCSHDHDNDDDDDAMMMTTTTIMNTTTI